MTETIHPKSKMHSHTLWAMVTVAVLALVMGFPARKGGFVGGDDHRLALNHVFVNHPSFEHALNLFTIPHRDLYQPLPLLTFQLEFAAANLMAGGQANEQSVAHVIHWDNIILHAINAVLVWLVIAGMARRGLSASDDDRFHLWVATVAAVLFAIHPYQAEVIAWLNGRMMLLSTLFALASMLSLAAYAHKPRAVTLVLTLLFVILCGLSKVRVSLPILLLLVCLAQRVKLNRRVITLGIVCGLITGVFVLINMQSTSEAQLFSQGAQHLRGPRLVRVIFALSFYFQHLVWPVGLCSYYPTPPMVSWSEPGLGAAALVVAASMGLMLWISRKTRVGWLGSIWFFAAIAVTLPIFPARNILAADRYMYLPIIGLLWMISTIIVTVYQRHVSNQTIGFRRMVVMAPTIVLVPLMIGMGWHIAAFYENPTSKTERIASLFPDTPRVWEPLGWTYLGAGRYEDALHCAEMELRHTQAPKVMGGGYQLKGMVKLRQGHVVQGLKLLHLAVVTDEKNPRAKYRLAKAYDELGRVADAIRWYEQAAKLSPQHNPTLRLLAKAYRRDGRTHDARRVYQQVLDNSKGYDVIAVEELAIMAMSTGTQEGFLEAQQRLTELLQWMPENVNARTNLGVVLRNLGKTAQAIEAYREVLRRDPYHLNATRNLAGLYLEVGDSSRADALIQKMLSHQEVLNAP